MEGEVIGRRRFMMMSSRGGGRRLGDESAPATASPRACRRRLSLVEDGRVTGQLLRGRDPFLEELG